MILVTGATGHVGRWVVRGLLDAGETVRAISRDPARAALPDGVEVVPGDLTRPGELVEALRGVDRAFLFPVPGQAGAFLGAAAGSGLRHVVLLSSSAVTDANGGIIKRIHADYEDALRASGLSWTFLRPGGFMANDLAWAQGIRAGGVVRAPFGSVASAPIDERDIAAVAVPALLGDAYAGQAYRLTGAEVLTIVDRVRILGDVLGRELRFEELTAEQARARMLERMPAELVDDLLGMFASLTARAEPVSSAVRDLTGREPHGYADWVALHAADFT